MGKGIIPEIYVRKQVQAAWETVLSCLHRIGENHFVPYIGEELPINKNLYDKKLKHFNVTIKPIILIILIKKLEKILLLLSKDS